MKLIHFGCSFAVGNGVPDYVEGLRSGAYVHTGDLRNEFTRKYGLEPQEPRACGSILADRLNFGFELVAENGASNEMIFRKTLETNLVILLC